MVSPLLKTSILLLVYCWALQGNGQGTQTGLVGMVGVPHAQHLEDGTIQFGVSTNPSDYKFVTRSNRVPPYNNEVLYSLNLGFIPRINLLLGLVRDTENVQPVRQGIGDRSIQVSFLVTKQNKWIPSIVLNLTDPFFSTNQYQNTNHIVGTYECNFKRNWKTTISGGYGTPYNLIWRRGQERRELVLSDRQFLTGIFGGIQASFKEKVSFSAEHDGQKLNTGVRAQLFNKFFAHGYLLGMKKPGLALQYQAKIN